MSTPSLPNVPDVGRARALAEQAEERFYRLAEEGPRLQKQALSLQVTEKSPDGLITATVGARGQLIRLDIDPRIYRRPDSKALAAIITETTRTAESRVREKIIELFAPLIPREEAESHLSGDIEAIQEQMHKRMRGE